MYSIFFVFLTVFALTGSGLLIVEQLDRKNHLRFAEKLIVSFVVGTYAIYFGVYLIGVFRLDSLSMWSLLIVCLGVGVCGWRQLSWRTIKKETRLLFGPFKSDKLAICLGLGALVLALSSLVQGLAPPNDYDSLNYHLSVPQHGVEFGKLIIPWGLHRGFELFPAMGLNLSRFALAASGDGAAQVLHGVFGIIAAIAAGLIAHRFGYSKYVVMLSAVFFLSIRVVIWEMGTVEVDVALAAVTTLAVLVYLTWRNYPNWGLGVIFGLLIGCAILFKYYGLIFATAFGPIMLMDILRGRISLLKISVAPIVAILATSFHFGRNYVLTSNPVFPIYNKIFKPEALEQMNSAAGAYGTGRGIIDLLITPVTMFTSPMAYFDGMIFGSPYLLVLAPLVLLDWKKARKWAPIFLISASYFILWFYIGGHQVRFLLPIMTFLAALSAAGALTAWSSMIERRVLQTAFILVTALLAINQSLFIGVYSLIRLPVAIGLMSAETFHAKTPTMNGAFYSTCSYLHDHLKPGEKYYSLIIPLSYYCPQTKVVHVYFDDEADWWLNSKIAPEMSIDEFIRRAENNQIRYFILPIFRANRRNISATPITTPVGETLQRFGEYFSPAVQALKPLKRGPFTAVYDGPDFITKLKEQNLLRETREKPNR